MSRNTYIQVREYHSNDTLNGEKIGIYTSGILSIYFPNRNLKYVFSVKNQIAENPKFIYKPKMSVC